MLTYVYYYLYSRYIPSHKLFLPNFMKKPFLTLILISSFFLTAKLNVFALTLDSIGGVPVTGGNPGAEWDATGKNPVFKGTATANSTVRISFESKPFTTTADSSGNWTYTPTILVDDSDYHAFITDDVTTSPLSFVIHLNVSGTTTTKGGETLPETGAVEDTLLLLGGGIVLMLGGWKLNTVLNNNKVN